MYSARQAVVEERKTYCFLKPLKGFKLPTVSADDRSCVRYR
jgi:hypothetical protein